MKKSFKTIIALSLVALTSVSAFAKSKAKYRTVEQIKKSGTIKIAVFSDKKPFGYVDEYGQYQGCHQNTYTFHQNFLLLEI